MWADHGRRLHHCGDVAMDLADARYGALSEVDDDGRVLQFLPVGIDAETEARIGPLPVGRGLLGVVLTDTEPLRLDDLSRHPASVGFPAPRRDSPRSDRTRRAANAFSGRFE